LLENPSRSRDGSALSGPQKAIILDPAANTVKAVFAQCFNPYHADSTKNWPHSISAVRMMHRDTQRAFPDFTWHKCRVYQAIEPITAQIICHGFRDFSSSMLDEAERPVDLHPGSSSALSAYNRIPLVNLRRVQVGWEAVHRFQKHIKVPATESIFRAIKKPAKIAYKPQVCQLLARILNISP
jgi:hypothetical protein